MADEPENAVLHHLRELRAHIDNRFDESKREIMALRTDRRIIDALMKYSAVEGRRLADLQPFPNAARPENPDAKTLYCSFCGKDQHMVHQLIEGPGSFICDECVDLCATMVQEKRERKAPIG